MPASTADPGAGASAWAGGSQVCTGTDGILMAEADQEAEEHQRRQAAGRPLDIGRGVGDRGHVHGVGLGAEIEADDPEQQSQRADEGVEKELQRPASRAPSCPQIAMTKLHPDQGQIPEDVEQEQVLRGEHAQASGFPGTGTRNSTPARGGSPARRNRSAAAKTIAVSSISGADRPSIATA